MIVHDVNAYIRDDAIEPALYFPSIHHRMCATYAREYETRSVRCTRATRITIATSLTDAFLFGFFSSLLFLFLCFVLWQFTFLLPFIVYLCFAILWRAIRRTTPNSLCRTSVRFFVCFGEKKNGYTQNPKYTHSSTRTLASDISKYATKKRKNKKKTIKKQQMHSKPISRSGWTRRNVERLHDPHIECNAVAHTLDETKLTRLRMNNAHTAHTHSQNNKNFCWICWKIQCSRSELLCRRASSQTHSPTECLLFRRLLLLLLHY